MNRPDFSRLKDAAAIHFMVMDILGAILGMSDSPSRMGTYLVQQIRELVGARIVGLVKHNHGHPEEEYRLVALEPARHLGSEKLREFPALVNACRSIGAPTLLQAGAGPEAAGEVLARMGCEAAIVVPLLIGDERVGDLIALDLLDMQRSSDVVRSLGMLAPVVGIVLRNAMFYETLELEVQSRTRELAQSERHFRTLTKVAPVGIFHLDRDQRLLFVNDQWRSITGIDWVEGPRRLARSRRDPQAIPARVPDPARGRQGAVGARGRDRGAG
jgi:PAS domain-containing protein